jgi:hypothetical protein
MNLVNIGDSTVDHVNLVVAPQVGKADLCRLLGYIENAGVPSGVVPDFIGQKLFDTTNHNHYVAYGLSAGNWRTTTAIALSAGEVAMLSGVTAGTGTVSQALVLDSSGNVQMPAAGAIGFSYAAPAAAGTNQTTATAIITQVNAVTGADNAKGVALPAASAGKAVYILNTVQTKALLVYPILSGNDQINSLTANTGPFTLAAGKGAWFIPVSGVLWNVDRSNEQQIGENNGGVTIANTTTKKVTVTFTNLGTTAKIDVLTPLSATEQWYVENVVLVGGGTNFGPTGDRNLSLTDGTTVYTTIANADLESAPAASLPFGNAKVPYLTGTVGTLTAAGAQVYFQYSGGTTDETTAGTIDFLVTLRKAVN